jgi:hypothetical protein
MDVNSSFLNRDLKENVFMSQREGVKFPLLFLDFFLVLWLRYYVKQYAHKYYIKQFTNIPTLYYDLQRNTNIVAQRYLL